MVEFQAAVYLEVEQLEISLRNMLGDEFDKRL